MMSLTFQDSIVVSAVFVFIFFKEFDSLSFSFFVFSFHFLLLSFYLVLHLASFCSFSLALLLLFVAMDQFPHLQSWSLSFLDVGLNLFFSLWPLAANSCSLITSFFFFFFLTYIPIIPYICLLNYH